MNNHPLGIQYEETLHPLLDGVIRRYHTSDGKIVSAINSKLAHVEPYAWEFMDYNGNIYVAETEEQADEYLRSLI